MRVPSAVLACLALGTVAHLLSGGHSPDLARTVVAVTSVTVLWARVAGIGPSVVVASTRRVTAAVLVSQGVVHLALTCPNPGQPSWAGTGEAVYVGLPADVSVVHTGIHAGAQAGAQAGFAGITGSAGIGVTAGHLLAAMVTAWWLARGEQAVWNWARRVVAAFDQDRVQLVVQRIRAVCVGTRWAVAVPVPVLCHGLRAPPS